MPCAKLEVEIVGHLDRHFCCAAFQEFPKRILVGGFGYRYDAIFATCRRIGQGKFAIEMKDPTRKRTVSESCFIPVMKISGQPQMRLRSQHIGHKFFRVWLIISIAALPSVLLAQNPQMDVAKRDGEQAFRTNRFPQMKGMTGMPEDQLKVFKLCQDYASSVAKGHDISSALQRKAANDACGFAADFYWKESQRELETKRQQAAETAQQRNVADELQLRKEAADQAMRRARQDQNTGATASPAATTKPAAQASGNRSDEVSQDRRAATQAKEREVARFTSVTSARADAEYAARKREDSAKAEAPKQYGEHHVEPSAGSGWMDGFGANLTSIWQEFVEFLFRFGLIGFVIANIVLMVGAANKKFVVFFDMDDFVMTAMIFGSVVMGYLLGFLVGDFLFHSGFINSAFMYLGYAAAILFSIFTIQSSISHNRSLAIGIFVGLMKVYAVVFLTVMVLIAWSIGSSQKKFETVGDFVADARNNAQAAGWLLAAAWLAALLLNGEHVYAARGWSGSNPTDGDSSGDGPRKGPQATAPPATAPPPASTAEGTQRTWYEVLGVDESALPTEIKAAWRSRLREYHPDTVATRGLKLREIAEKETAAINAALKEAIRLKKL